MSGSILLRGPDGLTYTASPYYNFGYTISRYSPLSTRYETSEWWEARNYSEYGGYGITIFEDLSEFTILAQYPEGWKSMDDYLI